MHDKVVIALTKKGTQLAEYLAATIPIDLKAPERFLSIPSDRQGYSDNVAQVIQEAFGKYRALILIMAAGIAVRSIAPLIRNKTVDPAVVVLDEEGRFVISLLSGHWGGANELAAEIAALCGGTAVITTASDVNKLPSLDLVAKKYALRIDNPNLLPKFAGAIVNGDSVVIWDGVGIEAAWPENIRLETGVSPHIRVDDKLLVIIGYQNLVPVPVGLTQIALRPVNLTVGIGCCQGISGVQIIGAIRRYFREHHWSIISIKNIATIDMKADEPGIIAACQEFNTPLLAFTAAELQTAMMGLTVSEFVEETTGVGGVCEPAAIMGANQGKLIGSKMNMGRITIAVAIAPAN